MWTPSQQEIDAVMKLPAAKRYEHFVKRVADRERLVGLTNAEGWASGFDDETQAETFAVWPHEVYAEASARDVWEGRTPEAIELDEWLNGWTPELIEAGRMVAVFPLPEGVAVPVHPERLAEDLRAELSRY
jgi:hypothetical protein